MKDRNGNTKTIEEELLMKKVKAFATKGLKTYGLMFGIILLSLIGLATFFATGQDLQAKDADFGHQSQEGMEYTYIELEVVEVTAEGIMFFDKTAEYEPNIFMTHRELQDKAYQVGQVVTGEFDEEGWELYTIVD